MDTARLRYLLADYFKVSSKNIHAYIMGEHGDSSFVPWKHAYVGCKSVMDIMKDNNHPISDLDKIHKGVVDAAYEIIEKKGNTSYGIGMCLLRITNAILNDENAIITVSSFDKDIYISSPCIINRQGIKRRLKIELTKEEQELYDKSKDIIKNTIK